MSPGLIDELKDYDSDDITQVIRDFFTDKNVDLKTEYRNPVAVSQGRMVVKLADVEGCKATSSVWTAMIIAHTRDMVSFQRKSRTEVKESIQAVIQSDREARSRLLGSDKEIKQ